MAFIIVPIACFVPQTYWQILVIMPMFGFIVQAFHAGYAIYFPELFPTHLRATGTSFCFNGGRFGTVPMMLALGVVQAAGNQFAVGRYLDGHAVPGRRRDHVVPAGDEGAGIARVDVDYCRADDVIQRLLKVRTLVALVVLSASRSTAAGTISMACGPRRRTS